MRIVVTGGGGFIGSHVVDALVLAGHEVFVIDHHRRDRERYTNQGAQLIKISVEHDEALSLLERVKPEVVVHLAAQISVTRSVKDPIFDAQENILNALRFMEAAEKAKVKKIIFASSGGAIYGDHPIRPTPEVFDTKPLSPYGIGKMMFERYLEHFVNTHGMSGVSLRFANLYGPRQQIIKPGGEGAVIPAFLERLLVTKEPFIIFGDGSTSRDFVYIDDAVAAIVQAILAPVKFEVVNISTGEEISIQQLVGELFDVHGQAHPVQHFPFRHGEVLHSVLSPFRAKEVFNWTPQTNFKDGLRRTYNWYKEKFGS